MLKIKLTLHNVIKSLDNDVNKNDINKKIIKNLIK